MTRVVLHIGTFKSGTTYLQHGIFARKDELGRLGVVVPGAQWVDQVRAVNDLRDRRTAAVLGESPTIGAWARLMSDARSADADVVLLSAEHLSRFSTEQVATVAREFTGQPMTVILGARDLARSIPAQWQTSLRATGRTWTLSEYLAGVMAEDGGGFAHVHFWRKHNWPRILRRWQPHVAPEDLILLTVPRANAPRDLLWERFLHAAGLPTDAVAPPDPRAMTPNPSLKMESAEFIRRTNEQLQERDLGDAERLLVRRGVTGRLAQALLGLPGGTPLSLPPETEPWARSKTTALVNRVRSIGPRIIGDLDDLEPEATVFTAEPARDVAEDQLIRVGREALAALSADEAAGSATEAPGSPLSQSLPVLIDAILDELSTSSGEAGQSATSDPSSEE